MARELRTVDSHIWLRGWDSNPESSRNLEDVSRKIANLLWSHHLLRSSSIQSPEPKAVDGTPAISKLSRGHEAPTS